MAEATVGCPFNSGSEAPPFFVEDIEVLPNGRTVAFGSYPLPGSGSSGILAFTAAGAIDPTWNGGVPIPWDSTWQIPQRTLLVDAAGRVLAREGTQIARFTATGAPDPTWGGDGRVDLDELFPVEGFDSLEIDDLEADGNKVVVGGTRRGPGDNHVFFARLTDTGVRRQHLRSRAATASCPTSSTCRVPRRRSSAATSSEMPPATST